MPKSKYRSKSRAARKGGRLTNKNQLKMLEAIGYGLGPPAAKGKAKIVGSKKKGKK